MNTDSSYNDSLQLRSNCYGYAIKAFYDLENIPDYFYNYKQQPGEFINKTNGHNLYVNGTIDTALYNWNDLSYLLSTLFDAPEYFYVSPYNNAQRLFMLYNLIKADLQTMGYTITEWIDSGIPNATSINSRMIAQTISNYDYHFYMQHSDNTWSHKPGSMPSSNCCISHGSYLTNNNIQLHATEGLYANGLVRFYNITKDVVIDWGHTNGHITTSNKTYFNTYDLAEKTS